MDHRQLPEFFAASFRAPGDRAAYKAKSATQSSCPFCPVSPGEPPVMPVVDETTHMWVVRNQFPYVVWESAEVADHLMILPKRHLIQFREFTDEELMDHQRLMVEWDGRGYSTFTRGTSAPGRSQQHIHTHAVSQEGSALISFEHPA